MHNKLSELDRFTFEAAIAARPEYWHVSHLRFVYGPQGQLPNVQHWGVGNEYDDERTTVWFGWSMNQHGYPLHPPLPDELPQFKRQGSSIWQYSGEPSNET